MITAARFVLSKLVSPLWRTAEIQDRFSLSGPDKESIRHLQDSVVTQLCLDYGMIDHAIYFTSAEVLGAMPLKVGDLVNCTAVRSGNQGGWKALRVQRTAHDWEDGGGTSQEEDCKQLRPLIGTVTSFDGNGGYINQKTYFPYHSLEEGYVPMKGDWVQAKYFINPTEWTTQACSVAPLRYCRLDEVPVTSMCGQSGVVNENVFFTMASLLLPADYQPVKGDLVNVVMLESKQSLYCWRALCMSPCQKSVNISAARLQTAECQIILENKVGVEVTDYGQFGVLMIGETQEFVLWIQNKDSETHRLKCCNFAGWDSEEQFNLVAINRPMPTRRRPHGSCSEPSTTTTTTTTTGSNVEDVSEDVDVKEEAVCSTDGRRLEKEVDILPGERVSVVLSCQAKSLGSCTELLMLHFASFIIGRRLEVTVGSQSESLLLPSLPYAPSETRPDAAPPAHVVTVTAPEVKRRLEKRRLPNFLPKYPVPQALRDCVAAENDVLVVQPLLGEALSSSNMSSRFSTLLWLEELHAEKEVKEFTINGALLTKSAVCLHLQVHGLTEGRPSVNIGDRILLKKQVGDDLLMEYVSYVTEINEEDVSLRVNPDIHRAYLGEPLDVEFSFNRLTMRRCHYSLEQAKHFGDILFPSRVVLQKPQWTGKWLDELVQTQAAGNNEVSSAENGNGSNVSVDMKSKSTQTKDGKVASRAVPCEGHFFNPELNPAQREAVKRIVEGECRPTPYVLFGPPGTGKTITLIEAILQVYHFLPSSRILVCTPSNSAADLIAIRLHESGFLHAASLARINATCRQIEHIPEVLQTYSSAGEDIHHAAFHRIVVSTCSSAAMLNNIGLQLGHFTHVFLDEAGQATEPESLIPISLVSEKNGQLVLAGDPRQLGPVVKSRSAEAFGLGVSLLERLMANPLYSRQDWGYNPKLVTKLICNYRSHEALLTLPSKLFYQGELCFKAPKDVTESLCQWKNLPKKGFPLLFHGVRGTEMRECNNPSWFNPAEAVQVMLYCCQLSKKLYKPVDVSDIGIISPYKKQCEKIRVLLNKVGLSDIKVGSVEEFQGQEFLVIILSTVRSNESEMNDDLQKTIGFLANPKRFNVAITRPKALLIVVGNPHILIRDPCFSALLHYTFANGGYLGCDPPLSLRDPQE